MDETLKLIELAHQGDKAARDRLVTDNMGLIWSIVKRFAGRGYEQEDLFQMPSRPFMYNTANELMDKIVETAREVFGK